MSSNNRNRRSAGGIGMAVSAAFAAALIASGPVARADAADPFEDLFSDIGTNSWTPTADASLLSSDPTLAGSLDTSVENFLADALNDEQFTYLVWSFDPSAFTPGACGCFPPGVDPAVLPDSNIADFAIGLDYTLFASGISENEVGITDLLGSIESIPAVIEGLPILLALLFA
jgi:hypothetical protein